MSLWSPYSPDGSRIVSGSSGGTLRCGTSVGRLPQHPPGTAGLHRSLCLLSHGRQIVSGSRPPRYLLPVRSLSLVVWDAELGACLNILQGQVGAWRRYTPAPLPRWWADRLGFGRPHPPRLGRRDGRLPSHLPRHWTVEGHRRPPIRIRSGNWRSWRRRLRSESGGSQPRPSRGNRMA